MIHEIDSSVHAEHDGACIFCSIVAGTSPAHIIAETDYSISFLSLEGHPLIIPKKHIGVSFQDDDRESIEDVFRHVANLLPIIKQVYAVEAFNIFSAIGSDAGQEVPHFHIHLIPRTSGDKKIRVRLQMISPEEKANIVLQISQILE